MALGPGKYDDVCVTVRERVGITENTGGGVLVIVLGGEKGNGFSMVADERTMEMVPDMLEFVAKQIRRDVRRKRR